ncbi:MAG: hypothetical protein KatS3mg111_0765 [Pirellulaceae bacterium]|nr:MAG: hypothetical protein KatS3mg111_0765 [Pirellulaceae bacterium]
MKTKCSACFGVWLILCVVDFALTNSAMGTDDAANASDSLADEVFTGYEDNISRVRTGRGRIEVHGYMGFGQPCDINVNFAFDQDAARYRFVVKPRFSPKSVAAPSAVKYLRIGDREYVWNVFNGGNAVTQMSYTGEPQSPEVWHALSLPIMSFHGHPGKLEPTEVVDLWRHWYSEGKGIAVEKDGIVEISFVQGAAPDKVILAFDREKGYGLVRFAAYHPQAGLVAEYLTEWMQHEDVYVPRTVSYRSSESDDVVHTASVSWESVNEPLDASLFEVDSLVEEGAVPLYSEELGEPVYIRMVGPDAIAEEPPLTAQEGAQSSWLWGVLVIAFVVTLLLGFGYWMRAQRIA